MNMNASSLSERLEFIQSAQQLKDTFRSAHTAGGRVESVAEHTWRLTLLIITFADLLPGVDLLKLLKMCILHDLGEAINGDIPAPQQSAIQDKAILEREDFLLMMKGLPQSLSDEFLSLWDEYELAQTQEAKFAKAFDKIETLIQHNQGLNPVDFDYAFNLEYGRTATNEAPLTAELRRLIDLDTRQNLSASKK